MGKLMMANGDARTGSAGWPPLLDVMGTETDWNPGGRWRPMSDAELLYRRALCKGKPYCFLMNTDFEEFPHELVEKYMKRSLAYGMFPGFFSHNASQGHYFTRPELYDRDRPLFKKYVPLCKRVAEAGWRADHAGPLQRPAGLRRAVRRQAPDRLQRQPRNASSHSHAGEHFRSLSGTCPAGGGPLGRRQDDAISGSRGCRGSGTAVVEIKKAPASLQGL